MLKTVKYNKEVARLLRVKGAYAKFALPDYGEVIVVPTSVSSEVRTPCENCIFEFWRFDTTMRVCPYLKSCAAPFRPDGASVKYMRKTKYEGH